MLPVTTLRLAAFDAMTFDVYGTLIDWEPTIISMFQSVADQYGVRLSREQFLLDFDAARAQLQRARPALLYPEVLRQAYARFCEKYRIPVDAPEQDVFGRSVMLWPAFDDTRAALTYLAKHFKLGLLSNIDESSLAYSHRKLGVNADVVVTAERVAAYKPDLAHFEAAFKDFGKLGIPRERILHVGQSLRADVIPANKLGIRSVWINRPGRSLGSRPEDAYGANPDLTVSTLAELVQMHRDQSEGVTTPAT